MLKNWLAENLQKKHALELQIAEQFEQLKKLEISLEKCAQTVNNERRKKSGGCL